MEPHTKGPPARLSRVEVVGGLVFLGLYYFLFPFLLFVVRAFLDRHLGFSLSDAAANALYYALCTLVVLVLFRSLLRRDFDTLLDRKVPNLFAMGSGLATCVILTVLVTVLPLPVENPVIYAYPQQYATAPAATVAILVLLWPFLEEVLFRGLVFGALRQRSRALAWVVSVALFLFFKVWQFALLPDGVDMRYLLLAVQYLPPALALTWCYDIGGSVWSSIFLHMLLNGVSLWLLL